MIYKHKQFILNTENRKVFDENGKELRLTGNAYRMLEFLCKNKSANLTDIGDFIDWAKDYTENHIRQYRYKINTIIGADVVEYRNGIYSLVGELEELERLDRNTDLLQPENIESTKSIMEKLNQNLRKNEMEIWIKRGLVGGMIGGLIGVISWTIQYALFYGECPFCSPFFYLFILVSVAILSAIIGVSIGLIVGWLNSNKKFEKMSYWLKGCLFGTGMGVVLSMPSVIYLISPSLIDSDLVNITTSISLFPFGSLLLYFILIYDVYLSFLNLEILYPIVIILNYSLSGAIIGFIIGKIKAHIRMNW